MAVNSTGDSVAAPRILITGNAGQLGRELERLFKDSGPLIAVDREAADLADPDQTRALVRDAAPDVILNAAAYTAVDRAEEEIDQARDLNAQAPRVLAEEALARNALFVHYSTDYVFDGSKPSPWTEDDAPRPLSAYGLTKHEGEQAIQQTGGRYLIFRTSWVYGYHGQNFLLTMLRLGGERERLTIVDDQFGAPTSSIAVARATHAIVSGVLAGRFGRTEEWAGLYHMTCAGSTSWFGFAQAIFARASARLGSKTPEILPIHAGEYAAKAPRPRNSVLSNERLHARFGVQLPTWQAGLDEVIEALIENR
jgi:dTDP-4-dehydrorhamnose reductase